MLTAALEHLGVYTKITASTNAATRQYPNASTLHTFVGAGIHITLPIQKISDGMGRMQTRLNGRVVLVIDEVSVTPAALFAALSDVMKSVLGTRKEIFANLSVILVGDFHQKSVPNSCSLMQALVDWTLNKKMSAVPRQRAGQLFQRFKRFDLQTIHRVAKGPRENAHRRMIHGMRKDPNPITLKLLRSIKQLTPLDFKRDRKWLFAPVVVTGNKERHKINRIQIVRWGRHKGLPVLWWFNQPSNHEFYPRNRKEKMRLARSAPDMRGFFVEGAPCVLSKNLSDDLALLSICKGARGTMESVGWKNSHSSSTIRAYHAGTLRLRDKAYCS